MKKQLSLAEKHSKGCEPIIQDNDDATTSSAIIPLTSSPPAVIEDTKTAPTASFDTVSETPASTESVRGPHDISKKSFDRYIKWG